jgi:nucleotide-binding universal stress UspA family protein
VSQKFLPTKARPSEGAAVSPAGGRNAVVDAEAVPATARGFPVEAAAPAEAFDAARPKVLVATRGGKRLIDFAVRYTKQFQGTMYVMFVRQINVYVTGPTPTMALEDDDEARRAFAMAEEACKKAGVPMVPMYVTSPDVPYAILDFAATYGVSALLMGVSRQGALLRALKGDVLSAVADHLPEDIPLLIHA